MYLNTVVFMRQHKMENKGNVAIELRLRRHYRSTQCERDRAKIQQHEQNARK